MPVLSDALNITIFVNLPQIMHLYGDAGDSPVLSDALPLDFKVLTTPRKL